MWTSLLTWRAEVSFTRRRNLPQQLNRRFPLDKSNEEERDTSEKIWSFPGSQSMALLSKFRMAKSPREEPQGRESLLQGRNPEGELQLSKS